MINYDKSEIREQLNIEDVFQLLQEWGGDPEYTNFGIISATICHNRPGEGSHKLYFYSNTGLFHCYTGCEEPSFDIFELVRKIAKIQWSENYDLNDAVRWVAKRFGLSGRVENGDKSDDLVDWKILANYDRIQEIEYSKNEIILKEYNKTILDRFNYSARLTPWLNENINQEAINQARIGFYPGGDQITIPHFDKDGRFIGLRGRTLSKEEAELYGKYRPLKINGILYNHPLGMNLYNFNFSKDNIKVMQKAIILESEKSCLQYKSYFGIDNDISVACCGSNISSYQIQLLLECGVKEIIIGFDKQFEELNTDESKAWRIKLTKIYNKYKNDVNLSFLWDKENILNYKSSPTDEGKDKFLYLFKNRIVL